MDKHNLSKSLKHSDVLFPFLKKSDASHSLTEFWGQTHHWLNCVACTVLLEAGLLMMRTQPPCLHYVRCHDVAAACEGHF